MVLHGAGLRTKIMFRVYVAGLYLAQKQTDANAVIKDKGNKSVSMYFLRELSSEKLLHGMNEGFKDNNSVTEIAAIDTQIKAFRQMMTSVEVVKMAI